MYNLNDTRGDITRGDKFIRIDEMSFDDIFAGVWSSTQTELMKDFIEQIRSTKPIAVIKSTSDASDMFSGLLSNLLPPSNSGLYNKTAMTLGLGLGLSLSAEQRRTYDASMRNFQDLGVLSDQFSADMVDKFWEMSYSLCTHIRCPLWDTDWGYQTYQKDFMSILPDESGIPVYNSLWQMVSLQEFTLKVGENTAGLLGDYTTVYIGCVDVNQNHRLVPVVIPKALCGEICADPDLIYKWLKISKIPPYQSLAECNNTFGGSSEKTLFNTLIMELNK